MKTKYIINNNEMIVSLDCLYELQDNPISIINIRKYINKIIENNNINFQGNKIIVYKNGLLIGTFYLTNYYLNKINNTNNKNNLLTEENSYFYETTITEIYPKKKNKNKKVVNI